MGQDLAAILQIERELETAPHWTEAEWQQCLGGGSAAVRCVLVGEFERRVVGFAVGLVVAGSGELESVGVQAAVQGGGLGAQLVAAVLAWCRAQGAGEVKLEVRESSLGARRLYQRLGFAEGSKRLGYYANPAEDAVLMSWRMLPAVLLDGVHDV